MCYIFLLCCRVVVVSGLPQHWRVDITVDNFRAVDSQFAYGTSVLEARQCG